MGQTFRHAQMWTLVKVSGKVAAEARLVDAGLEKGFYRITASCGLGVDITCNSKADNANIRIRSKLNSGAQIFRIFPQGDGTYRINGYNSIKYFDMGDAGGMILCLFSFIFICCMVVTDLSIVIIVAIATTKERKKKANWTCTEKY